jgi:selenocysteine-specific elongation factor
MLGTAGHVDHGKTAVVQLLTGCDTDTLAEEKQRGMTIDLGFAPCRLANDRIVGVIDVPGHTDFIRNMVAGAHGIDVVMLVVAADDGIMPQTLEHLQILTLMGVRHGIVVLNKIDLVDPARQYAVRRQLQQRVAGTFLDQAPICPLSTVTGEGFEEFFDALNRVTELCEDRPTHGLFRLWIEDVFSIRGAGTVVTGIPTQGQVHLEDDLTVYPTKLTSRIRRLQVYGTDAPVGRAGECVALNLPDLDPHALRRGMILAHPGSPSPVSRCHALLTLLPGAPQPLKHRSELHLHIGTAYTLARPTLLECPQLNPGQSQIAQLQLAAPLPIAPRERFVIRLNTGSQDRPGLVTVGGGRIIDISPPHRPQARPQTVLHLKSRALTLDQPQALVELTVRHAAIPIPREHIAQCCCLPSSEVESFIESLRGQGTLLATPAGSWTHVDTVSRLATQILAAVEHFHQQHPDRLGLDAGTLAASLKSHPDLIALALQSLDHNGQIKSQRTTVALPNFIPHPTGADSALAERIARICLDARWTPPTLDELPGHLSLPLKTIEPILGHLVEQGVLVRLPPNLLFHRSAIDQARRVALTLFNHRSHFTTMEFRDALDVSRKFAVPILDHLDATRFTVRTGNQRTPGVEARKLIATHSTPTPPPQH